MLGAIIGDIVGSRFEWENIHSKRFRFFDSDCHVTDDSVMTLALADAILRCEGDYDKLSDLAVERMRFHGSLYPYAGYGCGFKEWLQSEIPEPYGSYGNGAAMRVSACGYAGNSLKEVAELAGKVTEVTHNHPEGMKGAEATAIAVFLARKGCPMIEILEYIQDHYYPLEEELDSIAKTYKWESGCQGTVPPALEAFFESTGFEDAIRNAISLGGDSDTLAAITGAVAGAYWGIPDKIRKAALTYLDDTQLTILNAFEEKFIH